MPIGLGTRLGPYEILAAAGAGGMGEVYRARDTRLERDVAVKVLPPQLATDPNLRERFDREAKAISSLNHPHICALYDIGEHEGANYLVMEFLEGQTLQRRLEKGPLPLDQVFKYALQIADALDKAHRRGIIHRDLKPGNIMLTKTGAKLMDFGLAKAANAPAMTDLTSSPTVSRRMGEVSTTPLTARGTIVGTFQYMAPEQLEGKEADARSDLFSFGAVLYEMATGKRAFEGKSQASLIASILTADPTPISTLLPVAPPALERVVKTCLAKHPDERWETAHDLKLQLQWIAEAGSQAGVPAPVAARRRNRELILAATAALGILAAIFFGASYFRRAPAEQPSIRAYIKPAPNSTFSSFNGGDAGFAVSPDGLRLAYVASSSTNGKPVLWVRSLGSLQAQPLAGAEGATLPFWSPDSRYIAFFADSKLKKIEATGGPPLTLCDAPGGRGGTWNRDGTIVFAPFFSTPLFRVSEAGGAATQITTLDHAKNESTHRWPYFLPDGRHFLFLAGNPFSPAGSPTNSIMVGSLDSKETKFLFHNSSDAIFVTGRILFLRQNTLMAQPFDPKRLEFTGDAVPIADEVEYVATRVQGDFSASDNGILAYLERGSVGRQLVWFDRSGKQIGAVLGTDSYSDPHISPDGKELAFNIEAPTMDIWLYDNARNVKTRFTFGSSSTTGNMSPVWSPDGRQIAYTSIRNGGFGIYEKAADGSGPEEVLIEPGPEQVYPVDWSPDGKYIAYVQWQVGGSIIWVLPLQGERKPVLLNRSQESQSLSFQTVARFSPDGKWVAYSSSESGRFEVYVTPFPGPGGKWLVSTEGGWFPQWRRDGRELFYVAPDSKIMSAEVKPTGPSFVVGAVRPLFETRPYFGSFTGNLFDVTPDGQRFIIPYDAGQADRAITLVVNWLASAHKE